jgi:acetylglutamate kinase
VLRHDDWATTDLARLRALLEECFGRQLDNDYFEKKKPFRIYLSESYRATAILTMEDGVPYLDKFAVTNEAQGEGIGGSIWQRIRRENDKLFWRSRAQNPINSWYAQSASGLFKTDRWWVFWSGMTSWDEIQRSVERALAMPATLHEFPA